MSRNGVRSLAVAAAMVSVVGLAAGEAAAASPDIGFSRSSGTSADASWIESDPIATGVSPLGNTHVGWLSAEPSSRGPAMVWGYVEDFDCDPGETPYGGGHGEEPVEGGCDPMGVRFLEGTDNTRLTIDRRLSSAQLTGNLQVSTGHDGTVAATPPVNMTWTASSDIFKATTTQRFVDPYGEYFERYSTSGREATVSGYIGPMNFTDDADDVSSGQLGTYRVMSRYRFN